MGHLEKRIIIGALGLVAVLLTVVIFKGLTPSEQEVLYIPLEEQTWPTKTTQQDDAETPPVETQDFVVSPKPEEALYVSEPMVEEVVATEDRPKVIEYIIKLHDTLTDIAETELGGVRYLENIEVLNPNLNASELAIGAVLYLPAKHTLEEKGNPKEFAASSEKIHVVVAGDSLSKISEKYYPDKWHEYMEKVVSANPKLLVDGNNTVLHIGDKLNLPE
ncbi:MAG: LysM peptidoglycan-binding domain-containing protein [Planctomycetota bacterium]|nr:LysM peptidoglycan-binding domain-containing protein [Planctomycetota bacterium]